MRYFVKENTWLTRSIIDFGWGNGYVLLDENHPMYGKHYDEINEHVDVHWGLTFSEKITERFISEWDELTNEDLGKWCIGFDTSHCDDSLIKWPKYSVEIETKRLFEQLAETEVFTLNLIPHN